MKDRNKFVRIAAVEALSRINREAFTHTISVCLDILEEDNYDQARRRTRVIVLVEALEVVSLCAQPGHTQAISAVAACIDHEHPWVRRTALKAMRKITNSGDEVAIATITSFVYDEYISVRRAARNISDCKS